MAISSCPVKGNGVYKGHIGSEHDYIGHLPVPQVVGHVVNVHLYNLDVVPIRDSGNIHNGTASTRRVPPGRSLGRKSTMDGWFRAHSTSSLPEVGEPIIRSDR